MIKFLLKEKNIDKILNKYKLELDGLYQDLKFLNKNRKYNYIESCQIRFIYSYLDYIISSMQTFLMSDSGVSDDFINKVLEIRNKATEISNFVSLNFSDVWKKDYSVLENLKKCV